MSSAPSLESGDPGLESVDNDDDDKNLLMTNVVASSVPLFGVASMTSNFLLGCPELKFSS